MRSGPRATLAITALLVPLGAGVGCTGDDTDVGTVDAGSDATTVKSADGGGVDATSAPDAAPQDAPSADTADATPPDAFVRVAWFAPPGYPAPASVRDGGDGSAGATSVYDACLAGHGTGAWAGPLLASHGGALSLDDVSAYFPVAPGQYDLRLVIVAPGQVASCDASDSGTSDFTDLPALASGAALTAVVTPSYDGTNPLDLDVVPLLDETTAPANRVAVRFANVAGPGAGPLSFGLGGGVVFTPWLTGVTGSAHVITGVGDGGADALGFVAVAPFAQVDTSITNGTLDLGSSGALAVAPGDRLSAFAVPAFAADGAGPTTGLVVCFDGQPGLASPAQTKCAPLGVNDPALAPASEVRFGDFLADPGLAPIEACLKYESQTTYAGPFGATPVDGGLAGLRYGDFSGRFDVHAGFTYDVRVVAGDAGCDAPLAPDRTITLANELAAATVVFTGYVNPADGSTAPSLAALTLPDLACHELSPVLRVANVDAVGDAPLAASLSAGPDGGTWNLGPVPYGSAAPASPSDACDYVNVPIGAGTLTLGATSLPYAVSFSTEDTLYVGSGGVVVDCQDALSGATCASIAP